MNPSNDQVTPLLTRRHQDFQAQEGAAIAHSRASHGYYYQLQAGFLARHVEPHSRVLCIGTGTAQVLSALSCSEGVGLETCPELQEQGDGQDNLRILPLGNGLDAIEGVFDYVLLPGWVLGMLEDVQVALEDLGRFMTPNTRLILMYFSRLWQPMFRLAEMTGRKVAAPELAWIPPVELHNFLHLAGYEVITSGKLCLLPARVPLLSPLVNRFLAPLPLINQLCVDNYVVARPLDAKGRRQPQDVTVSVLVPARNEAGNIQRALDTIPEMGAGTEIVFVEGGSTDDTWQVIQDAKAANPDRPMLIMQQDGKGKGDAVRKGYAAATGDIFMILDADLTVPPETLPRFFQALVTGKGEFINGSRMVYPQEDAAMRFANLLGNRLFGMLLSWLMGQRIRDSLCGTKVVWKQDWQRIQATRAFFGYLDPFGDFDMLFGAAKLDMKILDLPIRYAARTYGDTNISRWSHGVQLLRMCSLAARKLKFR